MRFFSDNYSLKTSAYCTEIAWYFCKSTKIHVERANAKYPVKMAANFTFEQTDWNILSFDYVLAWICFPWKLQRRLPSVYFENLSTTFCLFHFRDPRMRPVIDSTLHKNESFAVSLAFCNQKTLIMHCVINDALVCLAWYELVFSLLVDRQIWVRLHSKSRSFTQHDHQLVLYKKSESNFS